VKRFAGVLYEDTRLVMKQFLERVIQDSLTLTEYGKRKTVSAADVVHALQRQGRTLYGYRPS
jgi:histone H4